MEVLIRLLLLTCTIYLLNACASSEIDPGFSELQIDLITMKGCPGTEQYEFDFEDEIALALKITNNSADSVNWGDVFNICEVANNNEEFYLVYEKSPSDELVEKGRLFQLPLGCFDINWPWQYYLRPKRQVILSGFKWLDNPDNTQLSPGIYYSRIDIELGKRVYKSEVTFTVK